MPYIDKYGKEFASLRLAVDSHCSQQRAKAKVLEGRRYMACSSCVLCPERWPICGFSGKDEKTDQLIIEALGLTVKES